MRKSVGALGIIIGIISILPFNFLAWWTFKETNILDEITIEFINAYGFYTYADGVLKFMGPAYFFVGILMILGLVFAIAGMMKEHNGMAAIGGILMIAAPLMFLWAHSSITNIEEFTGSAAWDNFFGDVQGDIFFGSNEILSSWEWYLNVGFFLPFGAGLLALLSAVGKK